MSSCPLAQNTNEEEFAHLVRACCEEC
jgi:hypothetical protein